MLNVEYINPFIQAAQIVMKELCQIEAKLGKPYLSKPSYQGSSLMVIIGITGDLRGQVLINMAPEAACKIASNMMMGMPVDELNDMAVSAISELGNMILGNAATIFFNNDISIDISPPSICLGENMSISVTDSQTICVPLIFDEDQIIEINIAMKER